MSELLIQTLDNLTPVQRGENGHIEFGWSNQMEEKIVQFQFQLTRTSQEPELEQHLRGMLVVLKAKLTNPFTPEEEKKRSKELLRTLFLLIGHTRDIVAGKGEYELTYMMILEWWKVYPLMAKFALRCLVDLDTLHPYGSWKDLKYFDKFCRSQIQADVDEFPKEMMLDIEKTIVDLMVHQLLNDEKSFDNGDMNKISLAAKWIPREIHPYAELYERLAKQYFPEYMITANSAERKKKALLKAKTNLRKLLSKLNRALDTLQIKQCEKKWSTINFDHVTSISMQKQTKAFMNIKGSSDTPRYPEDEDRNQCSLQFRSYVDAKTKSGKEVKGKRVGFVDFTKTALRLKNTCDVDNFQADLLDSQWRDNAKETGALDKMIAMVDVSGSMEGDPMHAAIALGIRIAEKSTLGNRVLTFAESPSWVNLEPFGTSFVKRAQFLKQAPWGGNTNFHKALDLILNAIVSAKLSAESVEGMVFVILSDMQMDQADSCSVDSLYSSIQKKYAKAGMEICGKAYSAPHLLFWNLRSTNGFPCLSFDTNASMMSGFSPALLNSFCDLGMDALRQMTPYLMMMKSLENERYDVLGKYFDQFL